MKNRLYEDTLMHTCRFLTFTSEQLFATNKFFKSLIVSHKILIIFVCNQPN